MVDWSSPLNVLSIVAYEFVRYFIGCIFNAHAFASKMLVPSHLIPFRVLVVRDGPNVILISRTETDSSRVIVSCIILCESEHLNT